MVIFADNGDTKEMTKLTEDDPIPMCPNCDQEMLNEVTWTTHSYESISTSGNTYKHEKVTMCLACFFYHMITCVNTDRFNYKVGRRR